MPTVPEDFAFRARSAFGSYEEQLEHHRKETMEEYLRRHQMRRHEIQGRRLALNGDQVLKGYAVITEWEDGVKAILFTPDDINVQLILNPELWTISPELPSSKVKPLTPEMMDNSYAFLVTDPHVLSRARLFNANLVNLDQALPGNTIELENREQDS